MFRFKVEQCKAGATMQTDNSNWNWNGQNPLYGAWGEQWMMDMASWYSSSGSAATSLTQAEMCSLQQAISEAMAAGAAGADGGASNFGANMYNDVANYIANNGGYSQDFSDKVSAIFAAAEADGRDEELDWLIATAQDMSGGYAGDWKGDAINGQGHGSAQYSEFYNLMDGMQNGGSWDALGGATLNGQAFDASSITEQNNGEGGNWENFDTTAYDEWITTSLDSSVMGSDYAAANTGSNSKYGENYDNIFGWRSTAAPGPTNAPQTLGENISGTGEVLPAPAIAEADLPHVTCVMDEQVALIEQYMTANGIGAADATTIKDAALAYLQANANNDDGLNPNGINTFTGGVENINNMLDAVLDSMSPVNADAQALTNQPEFATLLAQLDLMSKVGDPSNASNLSKEDFKLVDWDSIITPGTTADTFDPATVLANLETAIGAAAIPSTVTLDELGRIGDALTNVSGQNITPSPTASATVSVTVTASVTSTVTATVTAATNAVPATTTVSGSAQSNAAGTGNDPYSNGGNNGYGSMYGDPHIIVKNPDEPAVCFDIYGKLFAPSKYICTVHF